MFDGHYLTRGREFAFRGGNVLCDVHKHGTGAVGYGYPERLPQSVRQLFHVAHNEVVLGDGHGYAGDVHFLEAVKADKVGSHVARDCHHGNAVHKRGGNAGDQVGRSGTGSCEHHARLAGCAGISVRRVRRTLFVGGDYMLYPVGIFIKRVVDIEHRAARITENDVRALFHEHFY